MRFKTASNEDIEAAVKIILEAVNNGVNYIDTSYSYLGGKAEKIVREALKRIDKKVYITVKSNYRIDKSTDECYNRICTSLKNLEIKKADFFIIWTVYSYADFLQIIADGSLYDGAVRAKKEGLIDHICMSVHAPPAEIIQMLESGKIEGITLSYSVLNDNIMKNVLKKAQDMDIGIITMNTLAGGVIPQNPAFFSFLKQDNTETTVQAAFKWCYSHPQITTMLSGMTSMAELKENIAAVASTLSIDDMNKRIDSTDKSFSGISGFCTGCGYCSGCSENIKTAELMHSYNALFFDGGIPDFKRHNKRLLENFRLCYKLSSNFQFVPEDSKNPCRKCGLCEEKCTQKIPIIERLEDIYQRFDEALYSRKQRELCIKDIFNINCKKIGFWPAGMYTSTVIKLLHEYIPELKADFFVFDKNENLWGTTNNNIIVQNPELIPQIKPDMIVILNYMYENEIYASIKHYEAQGIKIVKLHKELDVPWVF
jgi:predicted aldo/keto reductase-like oxidoreductase